MISIDFLAVSISVVEVSRFQTVVPRSSVGRLNVYDSLVRVVDFHCDAVEVDFALPIGSKSYFPSLDVGIDHRNYLGDIPKVS